MTRAAYTQAVRANLTELLNRAEQIETYARNHAPEIREALAEARGLARKHGVSGLRMLLIAVMAIFNPVAAIAQILKYLDTIDSSVILGEDEVL